MLGSCGSSRSRTVKGFGAADEYLTAANSGYRFLLEHFLDRDRGGYAWSDRPIGPPVNDAKILYGQAFVIYAFVEHARGR